MPISIKLQKILMFIPGLNYALFLVAYYNMFYVEKLTGKQLVIGVVECIPVIVIEDLFYRIIASGFWRKFTANRWKRCNIATVRSILWMQYSQWKFCTKLFKYTSSNSLRTNRLCKLFAYKNK